MKSLKKAKIAKNDEFYTRYEDIEEEVQHYRNHFSGKTVYCNCDDPAFSKFWSFFCNHLYDYGLKRLICTYYHPEKSVLRWDYDGTTVTTTELMGDGDFRSEESLEILKEADIVVTNPPFSLFSSDVTSPSAFFPSLRNCLTCL